MLDFSHRSLSYFIPPFIDIFMLLQVMFLCLIIFTEITIIFIYIFMLFEVTFLCLINTDHNHFMNHPSWTYSLFILFEEMWLLFGEVGFSME